MRLIVNIKLPASVELTPLDILDELPCKSILDDIVLLFKFNHNDNYALAVGGEPIDHTRTLTDNGIRNGGILELIHIDKAIVASGKLQHEPLQMEKKAVPSTEAKVPPKIKTKEDAENRQPIPGKKIDFD